MPPPALQGKINGVFYRFEKTVKSWLFAGLHFVIADKYNGYINYTVEENNFIAEVMLDFGSVPAPSGENK